MLLANKQFENQQTIKNSPEEHLVHICVKQF